MSSILSRLEQPQQLRRLLLGLLFQVYKWLIFIPVLAISTGVLTIIMALYMLMGGKKYSRIAPILWARINARSAPSTVSVVGRENIDRHQSYVVVANHQSHFDVLAIYGWLNVDIRWVMKQELRKVPFLGYACELLGHVYIDRSAHHRALASIETAKPKLVNGISIFFFPEGTRSEDGNLLPFKKGAFRLAKELGLPILPITIKGTHEILPANSLHLMPGHVDVIVHPPIDVDENSSVDHLLYDAREAIKSGY